MAPSRSNGLDALRALAILLVFTYHYMVFVSGEPTFGWASSVGWVGVDLFFVLSGYLIGNQVFAGLAQGRSLSLSAFYARRALRTWPAFWLVLAAYFLFPSEMGGRTPPPLWRFLSFTQNFQLVPGTAFSHAWSLCIEEQFYLVLPLVALLAMRCGSRRSQAWALLIGLAAVGIVARAVLWSVHGREDISDVQGYYPHIYYATLCRFDEFLPGIGIALLKNLHPRTWAKVEQRGLSIFWLGLLATALMLYGVHSHYYVEGYGYPFFMTVFGYTLVACAFAVLLASALSARSPLSRLRLPGAPQLALWSYSIYLSHKAVAFILSEQAKQLGLHPGVRLLLIVAASVLVGFLLYRLIELPFMKLRDRWVPSLFTNPSPDLMSAGAASSSR